MSEATVKPYEIDDTIYELRPLVFGQWQQLNRIMDNVAMPVVLTPRNLVAAIGDKLDLVLAVILTEQGQSPGGKNLPQLAERLAFAMPSEQVAEVVAGFFDCNPIASILNLVVGVIEKISQTIAVAKTGSSAPSSSCATETGPSETPSSGDAFPETPDHGSSTEGAS